MSELPEIGKISPEIFSEVIFPRLGAISERVLVGPQHGVDVGIVEIGDKAVALTTDPVFIVPEYGWERAAWFAIHILASDLVTSGLKPCFIAIDLNLPMEITKDLIQLFLHSLNFTAYCQKIKYYKPKQYHAKPHSKSHNQIISYIIHFLSFIRFSNF